MKEHDGAQTPYYLGTDAQGFIHRDDQGEYIIFNDEKRYWRGQVLSVPTDIREWSVENLGIILFKPDAVQRGYDRLLIQELKRQGLEFIHDQELTLSPTLVIQLYPHFFTPQWEADLVRYMISGPSRLLVVRGEQATTRLLEFRSTIRSRYACGPIVNLIHCADGVDDVRRELLLLLGRDGLAGLIRGGS